MTSEIEYASVPMKIIASIEDIKEALRNNLIFSEYRELLKQVNICILNFKDLETNRTYLEIFFDSVSRKREKVVSENSVTQLEQLKEALLTGLILCTKLHVQRENLQDYFRNFKIVSDEQIGENKEIQNISNIAKVESPSGNEDKYFKLAKCIEGDRSMKYQQIQEFKDYINDTLLDEITVKNQNLSETSKAIDEQLHSREVMMYLASSLYSESKDKALKEIQEDQSDLNVDICEKFSIKIAEITCKSYLKHEFNCSNEETEEILNEIQRSVK